MKLLFQFHVEKSLDFIKNAKDYDCLTHMSTPYKAGKVGLIPVIILSYPKDDNRFEMLGSTFEVIRVRIPLYTEEDREHSLVVSSVKNIGDDLFNMEDLRKNEKRN